MDADDDDDNGLLYSVKAAVVLLSPTKCRVLSLYSNMPYYSQ